MIVDWSIPGSEGEPIYGNTHLPDGDGRGVIVIAHGFKGYKDYGMFPCVAEVCCEHGWTAHRFNFSHSGMTNDTATFARPDLFERDTWNRQVFDLGVVVDAVRSGALAGARRPLVVFGHSRGGVTALLTAGRGTDVEGVITAAAPDRTNALPPEAIDALRKRGFLESPSSRTGQLLRVGRAFLDEIEANPAAHDVLGLVDNIDCHMLVAHGEDDPTVPVPAAAAITEAAGDRVHTLIVEGGDHVFNTPNPFPADAEPSPQLQALLDGVTAFLDEVA